MENNDKSKHGAAADDTHTPVEVLVREDEADAAETAAPGPDAGASAAPTQDARMQPRWPAALAVLAFVLALASAAGGYWLWLQGRDADRASSSDDAQRFAELEQKLNSLQQQHSTLAAAVEQRRAGLAEAVNKLERSQAQLGQAQQTLGQDQATLQAALHELHGAVGGGQRRSTEVLITELGVYLRLAEQQLRVNRDPVNARAALAAAQAQLARLQGLPGLAELSREIEAALDAVAEVKSVDAAALLRGLDGLEAALAALPLPEPAAPETVAEPPPLPSDADWRSRAAALWRATLAQFKSLVIVKRTTADDAPFLAPDEQRMLRHNLTLKLEAARLAVLARQPHVYRESLHQARGWVTRYFSAGDSAVNDALALFDELSTVQLAPPLPDISAASREFERVHAALLSSGAAPAQGGTAQPSGERE